MVIGPVPGSPQLRERVDRLCAQFEALAEGPDLVAVRSARSILDEPVRVAVVGRVSTGKSTLVNALVGRRIAPTRAGECTRVVTWYRYGTPDSAQLHLRDGSTRPVRFVEGGLPEDLDVPAEHVAWLEVRLASGPLRTLTLIDTPGLDTVTAEHDRATRHTVLGEVSQQAAGQADALIHLVGDAARVSDVQFLTEFSASSGSLAATSLNAVGVLSQADRYGTGPFDADSPFDRARHVAQKLAADHSEQVARVVAVSGLLAETARTGRITEEIAARLDALADEDPIELSLRADDPQLKELLDRFGPYGVRAGRDRARGGASDLAAWAHAVSGIEELETAMRTQLVPRADVLRAMRTLAVLGGIARSWPPARRAGAMDLLEAAVLEPALHPVREFHALAALLRQVPESPMVQELERFVDLSEKGALGLEGQPNGDVVALARARSSEATRAATLARHPEEVEAGRVLARSWFLLARRLAEGSA